MDMAIEWFTWKQSGHGMRVRTLEQTSAPNDNPSELTQKVVSATGPNIAQVGRGKRSTRAVGGWMVKMREGSSPLRKVDCV
jgi:hypothetical protein